MDRLRTVAIKNRRVRSFIGMGYYGTITPSVILRNLFENPSWYTPYTPYQAEIAQGRLESLLNFQTMVRDLTAMEIATASLLDEATAAAEAMTLLHRVQSRQSGTVRNTFWVSERVYPQTLEVLKGRAEPLGIAIALGDPAAPSIGDDVFGVLVQSPDDHGALLDLRKFIATRARPRGAGRRGHRSAGADHHGAPRRDGRGCRDRQRSAIRRTYGLRRPACGVSRDARSVRAPGTRANHRRLRRCPWQSRLPHGAADARAAHPAREGHVEHLHRPGTAGEHGRDVRRVPRP